jgi:hypothetical protein
MDNVCLIHHKSGQAALVVQFLLTTVVGSDQYHADIRIHWVCMYLENLLCIRLKEGLWCDITKLQLQAGGCSTIPQLCSQAMRQKVKIRARKVGGSLALKDVITLGARKVAVQWLCDLSGKL